LKHPLQALLYTTSDVGSCERLKRSSIIPWIISNSNKAKKVCLKILADKFFSISLSPFVFKPVFPTETSGSSWVTA